MRDLGISKFVDWWIVTLPLSRAEPDPQIQEWLRCTLGYTTKGAWSPHHFQDYWFNNEADAQLTWITWG